MNLLTVPATQKINSVVSNHKLAVVHAQPTDEMSLEERVTLLLIHDLVRLGWRLKSNSPNSFKFAPPETYNKQVVKAAMAFARNDILASNSDWINRHLPIARQHLASGRLALSSAINPRVQVCRTQADHDLFRIYRYYWSSPYSEYVGRRLRLLIRDDAVAGSPIIGIAALGSSIIHIPDRDNWIGWAKATRTNRIVYVMDAYVLGAVPPYNSLLGGKLIAYILASNEVRDLYQERYRNTKTLIHQREASDLALIVTSSLYGKNSSQYNRLKYHEELLYQPIGATAGFGTLHISNRTFEAMKTLAESKGYSISNRFGDGPNWRMRIIRTACQAMDLDAEVILRHSFQRGLYAVPLADNWRSFLLGESDELQYKDMPMRQLVDFWKTRWFAQRIKQSAVVSRVEAFDPAQFTIEPTLVAT